MIRLTLHDGTRTQLAASDITDIEPAGGGGIGHRISGEPLRVLQSARTIETRMNAELVEDGAAAAEVASNACPQATELPGPTITAAPARSSSFRKARGWLLGKTSPRAMIGARSAPTP
jgi:hypothetical protein